MASKAIPFTTPVGRFVWGSMYKPRTTDAEGKPLVSKSGPSAGQPREDFSFGVAIPKGAETHWSQTEWGAKIWQAGHTGFPQGQANAPTFAWKVTDGDSNVPNRKGKKPCDREGYPRHWVLSFSSSYAPRLFNSNGSKSLMRPDEVPAGQSAPPSVEVVDLKCGYWVQVAGDVDGNNSPNQPGVYLNHRMVAFSGYGEEIVQGPDPASAGFGQAPLPAGVSATPPGGMPVAAPVPVPVVSAPPAYTPPAPTPPVLPAAPPAPHYPILGAGAPATVPPISAVPVPVPPPAPVRQMTAAAGGASYDQLIAAGWTDEMLRSNGLML